MPSRISLVSVTLGANGRLARLLHSPCAPHQTGLAAPVSLILLGSELMFLITPSTCIHGELTLLFLSSAGNAGGEGADHASADSQA